MSWNHGHCQKHYGSVVWRASWTRPRGREVDILTLRNTKQLDFIIIVIILTIIITNMINWKIVARLTIVCYSFTGNFTCLAVVFNLRRRLGYHLFHTYIPSALIVVMSWISFWIKPEAIPARVTLGVTSLLTLGRFSIPKL